MKYYAMYNGGTTPAEQWAAAASKPIKNGTNTLWNIGNQ